MSGGPDIDFPSWKEEFRRTVSLGEATDVPCEGCTACCRSRQFIHIGPDETDTVDHIATRPSSSRRRVGRRATW